MREQGRRRGESLSWWVSLAAGPEPTARSFTVRPGLIVYSLAGAVGTEWAHGAAVPLIQPARADVAKAAGLDAVRGSKEPMLSHCPLWNPRMSRAVSIHRPR